MFANALSAIFALAFARTAFASVYTTNPVATTLATGGHVLTVEWAESGDAPHVEDIGPCSVDLYTGSMNTQTFLQNLGASVDVSKTSQISSTIDPSVGQDGAYYFVRFTSLSLKDTKNPQYPYQAFSAKFTLNSMTGKFNATVLAQIDGSAAVSSVAAVSSAATSAKASTSKIAATVATTSASSSKSSTGAAGQSFVADGALMAVVAGFAGYLAL